MSRRRRIIKREILPDPVYGEVLVSRCINVIMKKGKKSIAEGIFYRTLDIIKEKTGNDPVVVFKKAINNIKPMLEVKSRRVGGATYQVPIEVRANRATTLALRWLANISRQRGEKDFHNKLAAEILDAFNNTGSTIKKKEDTHKMADANKAFAHYRW